MSSAPLLGAGEPFGECREAKRPSPAWLRRLIDTEEAWAQLQFALPMVLTNMSYYAIPLVSVMFSGHLGNVHLAGATLGNSWATVTGYAFVHMVVSDHKLAKSGQLKFIVYLLAPTAGTILSERYALVRPAATTFAQWHHKFGYA
ncbi:unnamed protein product [Triticum turgidum subsp. durum]|uniref:Protein DETOXIFICATION n=1 Tax=Triticum turgidum subsp. durum TaxID=4567 RepID=A0A9R0PRS5_TRITD|nr:unnamed protein product [Triticum turgidum subsp. durum]